MESSDIVWGIFLLFFIGATIVWGLQKVAENIAYGWHKGRLQAMAENKDIKP